MVFAAADGGGDNTNINTRTGNFWNSIPNTTNTFFWISNFQFPKTVSSTSNDKEVITAESPPTLVGQQAGRGRQSEAGRKNK